MEFLALCLQNRYFLPLSHPRASWLYAFIMGSIIPSKYYFQRFGWECADPVSTLKSFMKWGKCTLFPCHLCCQSHAFTVCHCKAGILVISLGSLPMALVSKHSIPVTPLPACSSRGAQILCQIGTAGRGSALVLKWILLFKEVGPTASWNITLTVAALVSEGNAEMASRTMPAQFICPPFALSARSQGILLDNQYHKWVQLQDLIPLIWSGGIVLVGSHALSPMVLKIRESMQKAWVICPYVPVYCKQIKTHPPTYLCGRPVIFPYKGILLKQ